MPDQNGTARRTSGKEVRHGVPDLFGPGTRVWRSSPRNVGLCVAIGPYPRPLPEGEEMIGSAGNFSLN